MNVMTEDRIRKRRLKEAYLARESARAVDIAAAKLATESPVEYKPEYNVVVADGVFFTIDRVDDEKSPRDNRDTIKYFDRYSAEYMLKFFVEHKMLAAGHYCVSKHSITS